MLALRIRACVRPQPRKAALLAAIAHKAAPFGAPKKIVSGLQTSCWGMADPQSAPREGLMTGPGRRISASATGRRIEA